MAAFTRRSFLRLPLLALGATVVGRWRSRHEESTLGIALTYDYEEGVDGRKIKAGRNGVVAATGLPTYSAGASKHGALGFGPKRGRAATLTYALPGSSVGSGSIYLQSIGRGPKASRIIMLASGPSVLAQLLLLPGGGVGIAAATGKPVAHTTRAAPSSSWTRVDWQATWDGAQLAVAVRYFPSDSESAADYQQIAAAFTTSTSPETVTVGSPSSAWLVYVDTVRLYDSVDSWPAPYAPVPTATFALPGNPTPSGVTVSAQVTGVSSIDLAVSSYADMSSAFYVGVTALDEDSTVQLGVTDLSPDTVYYAQLAMAPDVFIGDLMRFRTLPSLDPGTAFTRAIAFGSCQENGGADVMGVDTDYPLQLAWRDQFEWGADDTINVGDFGYWGAFVLTVNGNTPDYTQHIAQYVHQMATMPTMRKVMAQSSNVTQRDDHEISRDNGESYNNPVSTQSTLAMQKVFASPPLVDTGDPPRGRYFSYNYGPQIKIIVTDGMSLDRSYTTIGDDGMSPDATFFGADQLAWIQGLLVGPECLKIIVSGKSLLGDPPSALAFEDLDKTWAYGAERNALMQYATTTLTTAGLPINCEWWGGDRHAIGYVSADTNPLGRVSAIMSSGYSMHGLAAVAGETYDWSSGYDPLDKAWTIQWMQITLEDRGDGLITRTAHARQTDCSDRSAPLGHSWAIGDGPTATDTWTY